MACSAVGEGREISSSRRASNPTVSSSPLSSASSRRAFDEPFMETKFAVIADRDDNAGDGAVFFAVDREILDALGEFVAALLEPGGFGHQRVGPLVLAGFPRVPRDAASMRSISPAISAGSSAGCGRTRRYCAVKSYAGSSIARVQAQEERNSAAFCSSFSSASRRTRAASSMKPSSSPLKRSRVTVPPAAS